MVVVVEVVHIDFTCDRIAVDLGVRFEMARDKLTNKSLTRKKSGAKPNFPLLWCGSNQGSPGVATAEAEQVRKSGWSIYQNLVWR